MENTTGSQKLWAGRIFLSAVQEVSFASELFYEKFIFQLEKTMGIRLE